MATKRTNADIYRDVTNRMIEALKEKRVPWQKSWVGSGVPMNYATKKAYRGINVWICIASGFESNFWLTFKQAKKLGGNVIKGSKGTKITYWNILTKEVENKDGQKEEKKLFILKEYTVFNAEQIEGIEFNKNTMPEGAETFEGAEDLLKLYVDAPVVNEVEGDKACYSPMFDRITLPKKEQFISTEEYYSTKFHELAHSTGHAKRLNREGITDFDAFGSHKYSKEELVAEMSACFMMSICGLSNVPMDNSEQYIKGWISNLENDPKILFQASKEAEKACNYMMGKANENKQATTTSKAA